MIVVVESFGTLGFAERSRSATIWLRRGFVPLIAAWSPGRTMKRRSRSGYRFLAPILADRGFERISPPGRAGLCPSRGAQPAADRSSTRSHHVNRSVEDPRESKILDLHPRVGADGCRPGRAARCRPAVGTPPGPLATRATPGAAGRHLATAADDASRFSMAQSGR